MKTQKEIFKASEGDQWYIRNKETYENTKNENDIIIQSLLQIEIFPKKILEIGCSNGSRLNNYYKIFSAECFGIDPSIMAIENGTQEYPNIKLKVGTADLLPFEDNKFDMIIFGFSLYLCDRKDLFKIAFEADRCLSNKGNIIIKDFHPPFPYKNFYKHEVDIYSFKMNYSKLFSWNPIYNEIFSIVFSHSGFSKRSDPNERVAVTILNKNEEFAYPVDPYGRT